MDAALVTRAGEVPYAESTQPALRLGDFAATLPVPDRVALLIECRRVLTPGGALLAGPDANAALDRWAALVGLVPLDGGAGWRRPARDDDPAALVSIVIPSSNPRYFAECIDSAIGQTYRNVEIVVSDDCETDAIAELVREREGRVPIRYTRNAVRLRTRRNYEQCLTLARGTYVKFLNDDDVLEPDCVATLVQAFARVPGLTLATSHRLRIDAASRPLPDMPATRPAVDRDLEIDGVSLANVAIMYGLNFIGEPSTALVRKRDLALRPMVDGERPFNFNGEEVRGAVDFAMWSRLLVQGNAVFFARRLSRFRTHDAQAQAQADVVARSIAGIRALQRQWIELRLFRRWPPHLLWAREFGKMDAPWRLEPVRALPQGDTPPDEALAAWRATERHAFETAG